MRTIAIILAGGAGKRMGTATNKQFLVIENKPIIVHTLQIFEDCRAIDGIYLVVNQKDLPLIQEEILETYKFNKIMKLVIGGKLRQDSVRNGLEAIEHACDIVVIHDGARPFITPTFHRERDIPHGDVRCGHTGTADAGYRQGHIEGRFCRKNPRAGISMARADTANV